MAIYQYSKLPKPQIHENSFIAPSAEIIGDVRIGENSSIWFGTVLRGDVMPITIGKNTNIQDQTCIHGTWKKAAAKIGDSVTIGHSCVLHGCEVEDLCLIGMGSILMDGSKISKNSIVGAGSLVTEGSQFKEGMLIMGRPAKAIRPLTSEELEFLPKSASNYLEYTSWYE